MARKFKAFVERDKPKKRGARQHKKNKNKHDIKAKERVDINPIRYYIIHVIYITLSWKI